MQPLCREYRKAFCKGFTLLELLIVIAVIGILAGLLFPVLGAARDSAKRVSCMNNLKHLYLANVMYADMHGRYVAAAPDIFSSNLRRWHGTRPSVGEPFCGKNGPLSDELGKSGKIRQCSSFRKHTASSGANSFEASCGGYGYNAIGVGSQTYLMGYCEEAMQRGMTPSSIRNTSETVMFCDCAFPQPYGNSPDHLIEYSFAEAYHWVFQSGVESMYRADPSIHFRHRGCACVVWCDGHISCEKLQTEAEPHFTKMGIGWFGKEDNSLFDPN